MISEEITKQIVAIGELLHKVDNVHAGFLRVVRQNLNNIVKDVQELEGRIVRLDLTKKNEETVCLKG